MKEAKKRPTTAEKLRTQVKTNIDKERGLFEVLGGRTDDKPEIKIDEDLNQSVPYGEEP